MKICCVQMNMRLGDTDYNFTHAKKLFEKAAETGSDTIVFPETWNTGFFPRDNLYGLCDNDGKRTKELFGALAKLHGVNVVGGSVSNIKNRKIYNTSYVFNRQGECIAEYDKTHLFTPMSEHDFYEKGLRLTSFELDGKMCGIIICYDLRFPELTRTLTVKNRLDYLFVVSQWPDKRISQLDTLLKARAIENQMHVVCCNSCSKAYDTVFGGHSAVYSPLGETLASAGESEEITTAECNEAVSARLANSINVFRDRREELYNIKTK